jgi:hypothetical protein
MRIDRSRALERKALRSSLHKPSKPIEKGGRPRSRTRAERRRSLVTERMPRGQRLAVWVRRHTLPVVAALAGTLGWMLPACRAQDTEPQPTLGEKAPAPAPLNGVLPDLQDSLKQPPAIGFGPYRQGSELFVRPRAEAGDVLAGLTGIALRPVADRGYAIVDHIPAMVRRPFEHALSLLLDNAVSAPAYLFPAHAPFGGRLPERASIDVAAYPQVFNGCGPTMIAEYLKGLGLPIATGEIDSQMSLFSGQTGLVDEELRRRGFSLISGRGELRDLKAYVASGYMVMTPLRWASGGGHYAVVTGYDDRTQMFTIDGWNATGKRDPVSYAAMQDAWGRAHRFLMVVDPVRDERFEALRQAGLIGREAKIQQGLSLSDLWVTARGEFLVEGAFRRTSASDDLTIRFDAGKNELQPHALGGSVQLAHHFSPSDAISLYLEDRPVLGVVRSPALYVGGMHDGLVGRVGFERGGWQAELMKTKKSRRFEVKADLRVGAGPDQKLRVYGGVIFRR